MRAFALLLSAAVGLASACVQERAPAKDREALIRWLVVHQDDLRDIPFSEVVKAATGKRIIPVRPKRDARWLERLGAALDAALARLNAPDHLIHTAGRVNEASHFIEDEIRAQINRLPGWKCSVPLTGEGREQRSGYPDLRVVTSDGVILYLDPKLYEAGSRGSTLRTFYYEPRTLTGKTHDDARQMLVGIEHSGRGAETLEFRKWELIDVSKLRVSLKAEFQTGNDHIYRPEMIVGRSAK